MSENAMRQIEVMVAFWMDGLENWLWLYASFDADDNPAPALDEVMFQAKTVQDLAPPLNF